MASTWILALLCSFSALLSSASSRKGHMAPIGESGIVTPIPFVHQGFPSPEHFHKEFVLKNKPLLMRGATSDMPATRLWSDAYMMAKTGPLNEQVAFEKGKKETRKGGGYMTFFEFLRTYNDSDIYCVNAVPQSITPDVVVPWPLQCEEYKRSFEDNVMWFSSGGTKSVIHHDGYENINCLLRGTKRFLFVNTTKYQDIEEDIIDVRDGSYGSVDVEKVDLDKYPFFEGMEFFAVDMKAGDCVYSPYQWIHQVQSWGSNLAVNVWWFKEVNEMVNINNCNKNYDKSMTFDTVAFHKTTEISDGANPELATHAIRNGIARLVFRATNSKTVKLKEFINVMLGNQKWTDDNKRHRETLVPIFMSLDTNKNKKLDIKDFERDITEDNERLLLNEGSQWLSFARIYKYPLAVDFSNESYKTIPKFDWSEIEEEQKRGRQPEKSMKRNDSKKPVDKTQAKTDMEEDEEIDVMAERRKTPVYESEIRTSISDRDEL